MNIIYPYLTIAILTPFLFMSLTKKIINNRSNFFIPHSIPANKRLPWTTYMYSTIHAGFSFVSGLSYLYNYISNRTYMCLFGVTVGYGIHDFMVVWKNKNHFRNSWKEVLIHHSTFMYAGCLVLLPSYSNIILSLGSRIILTELSTIFLNISWFMYNMKYRNNILFLTNNILLLSTYFTARILNLTYCSWLVYDLRHTYPLYFVYPGLVVMSGLTYLNYKWFYALCKRAVNSVKNNELENGKENGNKNQIDNNINDNINDKIKKIE